MADQQPEDLLTQARQRAQTLLANLLAQQAELDNTRLPLPPEQLAAGREAMARAVAACRKLVEQLSASGQPAD